MAESPARPWALWIVSGLLTLAFLAAGGNKLLNPAEAGQMFSEHFGLPTWFALFIGACEVAGAVGLWLPRLQTLAACGLSVIMLGAAGSHVRAGDPAANVMAPLVLLALLVTVILLRTRAVGAGRASPPAPA